MDPHATTLKAGKSAQGAFRLAPAQLDRIEQAFILVLWLGLLRRFLHVVFGPGALLPAMAHAFATGHVKWDNSLLMLLSETAVMVFVMIRRPTQAVSLDLGDWMLAITATAAPLLILPAHQANPVLASIGVGLVLFGNVIQASAKLALRRSFGIAPANRGVKVSGPYAILRHPMYGGYLWVHIGGLLMLPSTFNVLVYGIGWWAQILRLQAEEKLLGQDPAYRAYAAKVRWRLVPGVF